MNPDTVLTDIRCGYTAMVHARGQQGCRLFGGYDWQADPLGCNGPLDDEASA